jgi:hypothetical protein
LLTSKFDKLAVCCVFPAFDKILDKAKGSIPWFFIRDVL